MHYIQTYILDKLIFTEYLRNKDMRPPNIESNLYQYHLKQLQKDNYIIKKDNYYTLDSKGLRYAGLHSTNLKNARPQPSLLTVTFIENLSGEILIRPKHRQPFIGMNSLLVGKVHLGESITDTAQREYRERIGQDATNKFKQFSSVHMTIMQNGCLISDYFAILLRVTSGKNFLIPEGAEFKNPRSKILNLSPGINEIVGVYCSRKTFDEFTINL
jgi:hypothetical protein